ncbi:molybdenum ABC transporter ATP-binding protein [Catenovulum sediminis]|uniref:molybdenum ABC transporter ATP-binding protein n=1 Tax=Catenovulum sediminis TaxID=1740262 RepID=UPI00117E2A74|nr:molybdenum ABC transporter ATP-binding protein [Catenovulum sediminis]
MLDNRDNQISFTLSFNSQFCLSVDLRLPASGVTAIYGPSGCGKTSFLRVVAGLEPCPDATIIVGNQVWQQGTCVLATHKRSLAYIFQENALLEHLNAEQNLQYAIKRTNKKLKPNVYQEVISLLGIQSILSQPVESLSGGERQRVAIARALLVEPKLLLMDEPFSALDLQRKHEILAYLLKVKRRFSTPIIFVSHSIEEVSLLADYLVVMEQGTVVKQGATGELLAKHELSRYQDEEIGVTLQGFVSDILPEWKLNKIQLAAGAVYLPFQNSSSIEQPSYRLEINDAVRVRILAKDISVSLSYAEDNSILNKLAAQVLEIKLEEESASAYIQVQLLSDSENVNQQGAQLMAKITRYSLHKLSLKKGDRVWVQIKSAALLS